jgi:hypothetical protein
MKYYSIGMRGFGGETVCKKLTKEQYDFWKDEDAEDILSRAFVGHDPGNWDGEENLISDEDDPRFLGEWYAYDHIVHIWGVSICDINWITIDEVNNSELNYASVKTLVDSSIEEFIEVNQIKLSKDVVDFEDSADEDGNNYIFYAEIMEKGDFFHSIVEIPDDEEFDFSKIEFNVTSINSEEPDIIENIINHLTYGDIDIENDIENDGSSTHRKGGDIVKIFNY